MWTKRDVIHTGNRRPGGWRNLGDHQLSWKLMMKAQLCVPEQITNVELDMGHFNQLYYSMIQHKVISVIEISREWPSFVPVIISWYYCIRYVILNLESGSKWSCSLFKFIFCTKLPVQKLVHAQILKFDWHLNRTQIALLGHTYICVFTRIVEDLEALISILIYYWRKCQSVW